MSYKIIIFGPQGSGKGTQAKAIAEKFEVPHISTGDILRKNIEEKTEIGLKIKERIAAGNLVPDEMINQIAEDRLKMQDCDNGFILDGYPRNLIQAEFLDSITNIDYAIEVWLSDEEAIKRIGNRRSCSSCGSVFHLISNPPKKEGVCDKCAGELTTREDDQEEAILKRLGIYHEQTERLIEYFKKRKIYHKIDGSGSISEVSKEIFKVLK